MLKKISFFLSLLFAFSSLAQTPIIINSTHMPAVGDTFFAYKDKSPLNFSVGNAGANQTYNFSNLQPDTLLTTFAVAPSATTYGADYPNANLALTNDHSVYFYYRSTAQNLKVDGFAYNDANLGPVSINLTPPPDQYQLDINYQDVFNGSYSFQESKNYNQLPPNIQQQIDDNTPTGFTVQQVRVKFSANYTDEIDAWGKVTTPIGTYDALRRKRTEVTETIIEAELKPFIGSNFWYELSKTNATTVDHSWLTTLTKLPLITLDYDSSRNVVGVNYSTTPPPPVADFTWNNSAGGSVIFTNTSSNSPQTYSWDFGDGSTGSTAAGPTHVYSANGTYNVCLTATNSSGTDTFCDSIDVTKIIVGINNAPVAVRDSAQTIQTAAVSVNVLANDYDPDNDNNSFDAIITSALNGTTTQLTPGVISYTANVGFTGLDSFQYRIYDNGNPVLYDSAWVVIQVDGPNNRPVAVRDSVQLVYPSSASINVLSNDFDPDGDNISFDIILQTPLNGNVQHFGVGVLQYTANANFRGIDSFQYRIRDDQTPALWDSAWVVIRVDGAPFADFTFTKNGLQVTFEDLSAGADSIFWDFGDGATGTGSIVSHTYAAVNIYNVCLEAKNSFGSDDICKNVDLAVGIPHIEKSKISISPNPPLDFVFVKMENSKIEKVELLDLNGKIISSRFLNAAETEIKFELSEISTGIYFINIENEDGRKTVGKFLKTH